MFAVVVGASFTVPSGISDTNIILNRDTYKLDVHVHLFVFLLSYAVSFMGWQHIHYIYGT